MRSKHLIAVALLVCVVGTAAVYIWQGGQMIQTMENMPPENFEVIYEWYSWTGVFYTITIKDNGTVIENYSRFGENKTTKTVALAENELQEFKNLVIGANVFDFENNYSENAPPGYYAESSWTAIKFTIGTENKAIFVNYPENIPEKLATIIQKIYEFRTLWW